MLLDTGFSINTEAIVGDCYVINDFLHDLYVIFTPLVAPVLAENNIILYHFEYKGTINNFIQQIILSKSKTPTF